MNQVDNIIFQSFLSLGWEKDENVSSLQDLDTSEIAKLMVKCLYAINPECELPHSLPINMSQRFRVAANIAQSIKDLGYNGDLGYQSLLYSNEADLRKILTFLIDKLPKDAPTLTREPLGKLPLIQKEMRRKLNEALQRPWVPLHCKAVARKYKASSSDAISVTEYGTSHLHPFTSSRHCCLQFNDLSISDYLQGNSKYNSNLFEFPPHKILATLLQSHAEQLGRKLSDSEEFTDAIEFLEPEASNTSLKYKGMKKEDLCDVFEETKEVSSVEKSLKQVFSNESIGRVEMEKTAVHLPSEGEAKVSDEKEEEHEQKMTTLNAQVSSLRTDIFNVVEVCKEKEATLCSLSVELEDERAKLSQTEDRLRVVRQTAALASDPGAAEEKLKTSLKMSEEKEERLKKQWLEFKTPLEQELSEAKIKLERKKGKWKKIEDEIADLKKTAQALVEEAKRKERLVLQLKEQKKKLNKGTNRAVYTKQILDVSAKVRKQKQEIEKILSDTRPIQKEINNLTGKLQRSFAVVEDASFKGASMNERARPIYRSVVTIHEELGSIVDMVRETGCVQRESADLQQQLNSEKSKNIEDNIKKLEEDLKKLKIENSLLKQRIN